MKPWRDDPRAAIMIPNWGCQSMKKLISILLSIILTLWAAAGAAMAAQADIPAQAGIPAEADTVEGAAGSGFQRVTTYSDGQFTDVTPEDWYSAGVAAAYELGLMWGEADDHFNAAEQITVVQAIAMAARLHRIYNTGSGDFVFSELWYEPYVGYAIENGILIDGPDLFAPATRAQFADLLCRALPQEALGQINDIAMNEIPDVKSGDPYAESVYTLYRAGITAGGNARGTFSPDSGVSRAEAAVMVARMADPGLRQSFTLRYDGPDLIVGKERDDAFFENAAILGNSLVDGLRMYSNLKSLDYFCEKSVSVISATKTKSTRLNNGAMGTLVQALCQEPHDKIYIELGINEIYFNVDYFTGIYGGMLDSIRSAQPEADIYILSILPVTSKKSNSNSVRNMDRIDLYNQALHRLAEEKQCYYMDLCSAYQGDDGYLPSGWSSDGIHLYAQRYSVWEQYMRTQY